MDIIWKWSLTDREGKCVIVFQGYISVCSLLFLASFLFISPSAAAPSLSFPPLLELGSSNSCSSSCMNYIFEEFWGLQRVHDFTEKYSRDVGVSAFFRGFTVNATGCLTERSVDSRTE